MRITEVHSFGIKGQCYAKHLGKVTLACGPNGSGKTSLIAAIQLALGLPVTGVGSANKLLGLLVRGKGSAIVKLDSGDTITCEIKDGKAVSVQRTHSSDIMSLSGGVPQTVDGLFAMTGEEQWKLLMSAAQRVGAEADLSPVINTMRGSAIQLPKAPLSDDVVVAAQELAQELQSQSKEIAAEIRKRKAQMLDTPPECSITNLKEATDRHRLLTDAIRSSAKAKAQRENRERSMARYREEIASIESKLAPLEADKREAEEHAQKLHALTAKVQEWVHSQAAETLRVESQFPALVDSAIESLHSILEWEASAGKNNTLLGGKAAESVSQCLLELKGIDTSSEIPADDLEVAMCMLYGLSRETTKRMALRPEESIAQYAGMAHDEQARAQKLEALIQSQSLRLSTLQQQIGELQQDDGVVLSDEQLKTISDEVRTLEEQQRQWHAIEAWKTTREENARKIEEHEIRLVVIEECISQCNQIRAEIIESTVPRLEAIANSLLAKMGLPSLKVVPIQTTKRTSLAFETLDGVDMRVIERSLHCIYGAVILHAFQKVCGVPLPLIFVEAAELDRDRLSKFLDAMRESVTDGNVIVAHWDRPQTTSEDIVIAEFA